MILLDTNAILFIAVGQQMAPEAVTAIEQEARTGAVLVSPISAWEAGLLAARGRLTFNIPPPVWFETFLAKPGIWLAPFTAQIAIAASFLPDPFHADPGDRLLVATARTLGVPIVTRDRKILAYGGAGHVQVLAC